MWVIRGKIKVGQETNNYGTRKVVKSEIIKKKVVIQKI